MSIFKAELHALYWRRRREAFERCSNIPRMDSLNQDFSGAAFDSIPAKQALDDLLEGTQVIVIAGAYFGDEAKGKWGNAVAGKADLVIRPHSGPNTGRTVCYQGKKLSLHLIPTAIVEGKRSIIGAETVGDPISLEEEELQLLRDRGINYDLLEVGNFFIITPYHRIMDVLGSHLNASTGVGMTPVHKSIKGKTCPRLDDLCNGEQRLREVIEKDWRENYLPFLAGRNLNRTDIIQNLEAVRDKNKRVVPAHVFDFARAEDSLEFLVGLYTRRVAQNPQFPRRIDASYEVQTALQRGERVLVEATQSYWLSNARQQGHRFSTSADVSALGALAAVGISPHKYRTIIINVNKFPGSSRVGPGDIPGSFTAQNHFAENGITSLAQLGTACSHFDAVNARYFSAIGNNGLVSPVSYDDETGVYEIGEAMAIASSRMFGEFGATTGKPRITGLFDCVLGKAVAAEQGPYTVISCLDRGDICEKVGLVVGYVVHLPEEGKFSCDQQGPFIDCNGVKYRSKMIIRPGDKVPTSDVLQHCLPIVKVMSGWKDTPIAALSPGNSLPTAVAEVLAAIEHYTGFKVLAIGTGPETQQALYLQRTG